MWSQRNHNFFDANLTSQWRYYRNICIFIICLTRVLVIFASCHHLIKKTHRTYRRWQAGPRSIIYAWQYGILHEICKAFWWALFPFCYVKALIDSCIIHIFYSHNHPWISPWQNLLSNALVITFRIIWTSAGILLIGALETNISEILIKIYTFSLK